MSSNTEHWLDNKYFLNVLSKSEFKENGCVEYKTHKKYRPKMHYRGKSTSASRVCWSIVNGEISAGLFILHSCDNKYCINIDHLRLGTQKENIQDKFNRNRVSLYDMGKFQRNKTHCPHGHKYSEENTGYGYVRGKLRNRYCKSCAKLACRRLSVV